MLNARNVIVAAVGIVVLSTVVSVLHWIGPPDRNGMGDDSYGVRALGYRAVFETLERLDVPVQRQLVPSDRLPEETATLILWAPELDFVSNEPAPLRRVADWVREKGGRLVLAPPDPRARGMGPAGSFPPGQKSASIFQLLGLPEIRAESIDEFGVGDAKRYSTPPPAAAKGMSWLPQISYASREVAVVADDHWPEIAGKVKSLALPEKSVRVLDCPATSNPPPSGTLYCPDEGPMHLLAVRFKIGKGEVIVVSDPALIENRNIGKADNAALACWLFAPGKGGVVFDEFYHGLTVRGNPGWLLSRFPYGLVALALLLATGVWAWRAGARLGPPLAEREPTRRNILEYVDAMASMFGRAHSDAFALGEVRRGVFWTIRQELHMGLGDAQAEKIVSALARKDPARARKLQEADAQARAVLSGHSPFSRGGIGSVRRLYLEAARSLMQCL